ncbi:MAG: TonB-dependent receptor [Novosphingobium sp.]|nr:TonB-dependent receptor [Novosphingobium sp.]
MKKRMSCICMVGGSMLAVISTLGSAPAAAQMAGVDSGEDIIVTARKRDESLQDVPVAVTVFSGEDLVKRGITSFNDLGAGNPNVKIQPLSSNASISSSVAIRGNVQSASTLQVDPSVGVYLDGHILAHQLGTAQLTVDVESVQTLKGPQGTLFGRNTTGGALLVKTRDPVLGETTGHVQGEVGSLNTVRLGGAINVPVGDVVALRLVYQNNSRDDYQFFADGRALGKKDEEVLRGKLLIKPDERTTILLSAEKLRESGTGTLGLTAQPNRPVYKNIPVSGFPTTSGNVVPIDARARGELGEIDAQFYTVSISRQLDNGEIKILAAHRAYDVQTALTLPPRFGYTFQDKPDNKDYSAELQYNASFLDGRLDLTSGLFYFDETVHESQNTWYYSGLQRTSRFLTAKSRSKSAYIQGSGRLTDQFNLTLGLRYTSDRKSGRLLAATSDSVNTVTETIAGTPQAAAANPVATHLQKHEKLNYLVSMDYSPNEDMMVYASHSTGYRAGGAGVDRMADNQPTNPDYLKTTFFRPESIKNYELGFKTQFLDRHLTINGALFYQDYSSYQYTAVVNAVRITQNADARIKGFELDGRLRLGTGTTLWGEVGYTDGKVHGGAQDGLRLPLIPRLTWGAGIEQAVDLGEADLTLAANYSWTDNIWTELEDRTHTNMRAREQLNLSATVESGPFSLGVFANNVTNEKAYSYIIYSSGGALDFGGLTLPRVIGVRAKYSF